MYQIIRSSADWDVGSPTPIHLTSKWPSLVLLLSLNKANQRGWPNSQSRESAKHLALYGYLIRGGCRPGWTRPGQAVADQEQNELKQANSIAPWPPLEAQSSRFKSKQFYSTDQPYQWGVQWRNYSFTGSEQLIGVLWSMHLMIKLLLSVVSPSSQIGLRKKSPLTYFISAENGMNAGSDTAEWMFCFYLI